ncbi:ribosomal-protein-serine acetyltransferase [Chitinophaga dinghuensis]|uniref:Ribosomal-protein-serine acetyltransferase n=1 Tax=Chitinophaga dinghuensis TaxID=1539050 RepID=A0A327W873_9BACT|nr:GNAT family protein [Chitinophaga dinghuensis]RAJ85442.1 ribosomal-protein-serine acetyltransferase [Chitinophaga dinghuensis]
MIEIPVNETLFLKQLQPEDAPHVYQQLEVSRKQLRRFLPWVDYNTKEEHSLRFIELMKRKTEEQEALALGIWSNHTFCGVIDLHNWDHQLQKAEIGYWVGAAFQGKGIATAASKALISYAFQRLHIHKIEIRFVLQNEQSGRIPIKLGFCREGVLRANAKLHGQFVDMVVMGVLKEDWHF